MCTLVCSPTNNNHHGIHHICPVYILLPHLGLYRQPLETDVGSPLHQKPHHTIIDWILPCMGSGFAIGSIATGRLSPKKQVLMALGWKAQCMLGQFSSRGSYQGSQITARDPFKMKWESGRLARAIPRASSVWFGLDRQFAGTVISIAASHPRKARRSLHPSTIVAALQSGPPNRIGSGLVPQFNPFWMWLHAKETQGSWGVRLFLNLWKRGNEIDFCFVFYTQIYACMCVRVCVCVVAQITILNHWFHKGILGLSSQQTLHKT